jgi:DNA repair exonuclease SbcCD ATPase subunit
MELEDVADELYEVPPEEFIAVRTERQNEAKADGDPALAKAIGALPKPSLAAWVCNVLVRAHRAEIEGLVELGDLLRSAQENLAGDQLRALNTQRGQLLNALTRRASAVARERGHPVSTSVQGQVEETLRAAMADPDAGEALLTGRLTSPMSYSGMGTTGSRPNLRLVVPPTPEAKPAAPSPAKKTPARTEPRETAADRREREREERRRAAEEKHRREVARAREVAEEAAATAAEARAAADEQRRQADELAVEHADLQARVEDLADQLAEAERAAGEAAAALKRAQRRRGATEREAEEAADAAERAAAHVEQLDSAGPG